MANIPRPLIDAILNGKCVPFIGAGFSKNANIPESSSTVSIPNWDELVGKLAQEIGVPLHWDSLDIAEAYEDEFNHSGLVEKLKRLLLHGIAEPGDAHISLINSGFRLIYTTNFDSLLEDACNKTGKRGNPITEESQLALSTDPIQVTILKLHGCLNKGKIVFTKSAYDKYHLNFPIFTTHMISRFVDHVPLFIGYSLRDPHFRHVRSLIRHRLGSSARKSYIIRFEPDEWEKRILRRDDLHPIPIEVPNGSTRGEALVDFFESISRIREQEKDISDAVIGGTYIEKVDSEIFESVVTFPNEKSKSLFLSTYSDYCFVSSKGKSGHRDLIEKSIRPILATMDYRIINLTRRVYSVDMIQDLIRRASIVIMIVDEKDEFFDFEIETAISLGKPIILLVENRLNLKAILKEDAYSLVRAKSMQFIRYKSEINFKRLKRTLLNRIKQVIGHYYWKGIDELIISKDVVTSLIKLGGIISFTLKLLAAESKKIDLGRIQTAGDSYILELLGGEKKLDESDIEKLNWCLVLKDRSLSGFRDITIDEVDQMLEIVKDFLSKYLKSYWKILSAL